jgi:hypothetical protein
MIFGDIRSNSVIFAHSGKKYFVRAGTGVRPPHPRNDKTIMTNDEIMRCRWKGRVQAAQAPLAGSGQERQVFEDGEDSEFAKRPVNLTKLNQIKVTKGTGVRWMRMKNGAGQSLEHQGPLGFIRLY